MTESSATNFEQGKRFCRCHGNYLIHMVGVIPICGNCGRIKK